MSRKMAVKALILMNGKNFIIYLKIQEMIYQNLLLLNYYQGKFYKQAIITQYWGYIIFQTVFWVTRYFINCMLGAFNHVFFLYFHGISFQTDHQFFEVSTVNNYLYVFKDYYQKTENCRYELNSSIVTFNHGKPLVLDFKMKIRITTEL